MRQAALSLVTHEDEEVWALPILGARLLDFGGDEALFYVVFDSLFVVASIHDPLQVGLAAPRHIRVSCYYICVLDSLFVIASIHDSSQVIANQPPLAGDGVHAARSLRLRRGGVSIELTKPLYLGDVVHAARALWDGCGGLCKPRLVSAARAAQVC